MQTGNQGDITGNWRRYSFKKEDSPEKNICHGMVNHRYKMVKLLHSRPSNTDFEGVDVSYWLNDINNNNYGSVGYIGIIQLIKQGDPSKRITGLLTQR